MAQKEEGGRGWKGEGWGCINSVYITLLPLRSNCDPQSCACNGMSMAPIPLSVGYHGPP